MNRFLVSAFVSLAFFGCTPGAELLGDYTAAGTLSLEVGGQEEVLASNGRRSVDLNDEELAVNWDGCRLKFDPIESNRAGLNTSPNCVENGDGYSMTLQFNDGNMIKYDKSVSFWVEGIFVYRTAYGAAQGRFYVDESWRSAD